jgi:tetratricopeptide (TPR) repeat protein
MGFRGFLLLALASATAASGLAAATPAPKATASVLPWIDDDYPSALAKAKAKRIPIFAELWAPWCHTCRSMQAFVFTDKALSQSAGEFVWLSINTEKARNAAFLEKFPIRAWPSFYVIDPRKETVALRWVGGATVAQLTKFFAEGTRAGGGGGSAAVSGGPDAALARADVLYAAGDYEKAEKAYADALELLSPKSPRYARAVEARLFCLQTTHNAAECVALARKALPKVAHTASAANLSGSGLDCAVDLPSGAAGRTDAVSFFESSVREVLADRTLPLAADDRSALYGSLHSALEEAKDADGAQKVAVEWAAYLDAEAAHAKTAQERTALDPNRLSAFDAAGEIGKAIPMLEASEKAFPEDYNPPARLALVYLRLKQYDTALKASDRALARVYGPRKLRVLAVRADIYGGMGDAAAAKKTVEESLAYAEALPAGQRSDTAIAALKKQLEGS